MRTRIGSVCHTGERVQELVGQSEFRDNLMLNIWQAYNNVTEATIQVGFKSSILDLAQLREEQAGELLVMREALTQSQGDASNLEKTLAMITGAAPSFSDNAARAKTPPPLQLTPPCPDVFAGPVQPTVHCAFQPSFPSELEQTETGADRGKRYCRRARGGAGAARGAVQRERRTEGRAGEGAERAQPGGAAVRHRSGGTEPAAGTADG